MSKHGFGIVGCGLIGEFHARAIQAIPEAELVAVADVVEASARRLAEKFGCRYFTDVGKMLRLDEIDIVTICTPSGLHADTAVPAAAAGKHVIVEKPLDITLERVDRINDAARKHGVRVCGIFPSRFHDAAQATKKAVDAGRFGRITLGDAYVKWWRSQEYYDKGGWKGTRALDGGGALMNQSIHAIDLLQWFMGDVEQVSAFAGTLAHERIEVEDTAVAALRFRSGALGVIEGATSVFPGFLKRLEICGSGGSVVMEEENIVHWKFAQEQPEDARIREDFAAKTKTGGGAADPAAIGFEGHRRQFVDFIRAIETRTEPLVNGEEARKAVEIILAIYRSAQSGRPVNLPLK